MKKIMMLILPVFVLSACSTLDTMTNADIQCASETTLNTGAENITISNVERNYANNQIKYIATANGKKHYCYIQGIVTQDGMTLFPGVCGK